MAQPKQKNENTEIDLIELAKALWKRAGWILLAGVICGALAFAATHLLITPQYQSSFTAYVNNRSGQDNGNNTVTSADLSASQSLVKTYSAIITSRSVLESAATQAGVGSNYKQLSQMVSTQSVDDTELICVSVTMPDAQQAVALAGAISEVAGEYITKIVEGSSMQIVDQPVIPTTICSPNYTKNLTLGVMLGIVLACGVIVLRELLDDRVKDSGTLETRFGIPVIGSIPNMEAAEKIGDSYAYSKKKSGGNR